MPALDKRRGSRSGSGPRPIVGLEAGRTLRGEVAASRCIPQSGRNRLRSLMPVSSDRWLCCLDQTDRHVGREMVERG